MDTRDKRASAITVGSPWRLTLPVADGALDQGDRQHVAYFYRGILAGTAAVATPHACITLAEVSRLSITLAEVSRIDITLVEVEC